jgi:hypothetical protein
MRVVAAPTGVFTIVGRVRLNGEADLPAVHALQDQFTITPLAVRAGAAPAEVAGAPSRSTRPRGTALVGTVPGGSGGVPPSRPRQAVRDPGRAVRGDRRRVALCGPDPALAEVPVAGQQAGQARIEELARGGGDAPGAFRPIMRMYQPQQPILEGTYVLPAVRKVG